MTTQQQHTPAAVVSTTTLERPAQINVVQLKAPATSTEKPHVRWDEASAPDNENMGKKSSKSTSGGGLLIGLDGNFVFFQCRVLHLS